jgi:predicted kinase
VECVILVGLPAAGKTTFYRAHFASTHVHVSKDLMPKSCDRESRQRAQIAEALRNGASVVVDNTNVTVAERATIIETARTHGAKVVCFYFESRLAVCEERNAARPFAVPLVALRSKARALERPSVTEGIDALFYVKIEQCEFRVNGWTEP